MSRKIRFTVLSSSSHEDNFSAQELMVHAPTVSGWRSSRLCSYPQHITLQLAERCRVKKLQLLAHHYLIPAKVEFHIGDTPPDPTTSVFIDQLRRLGYVSLSDNEKTGFRARELKSVHVDAVGTYLRITFHKHYANRHNHYNQVALVAFNVLGDPLDGSAFHTIPSREQLIEHYLNGTQLEAALDGTLTGKYDSTSPLDDLAFDMYQDPEVARIIRHLNKKKQDMVHQERFEHAKYLKQAIADLQKAGEHLARFDVEMQSAMEKKEYDLAKKKKDEMDEYRRSVYQQLEVHNLLDMGMITSELCPSQEVRSPLCSHPSLPAKPFDTKRKEKAFSKTQQSHLLDSDAHLPKQSNSPDTPCASSALLKNDFSSVSHDERLPTASRKDQPAAATQSPAIEHSFLLDTQSSLLSPEVGGEPEPLSEKVQREAGLSIEVYGESLVASAYSKSWSNREAALLAVHKKLLEVPSTTPKDELRNMIRAAVFLVKRALLEKVSPVFQASLKLLFFMLSQLIPGLGRVEVTYCLENTWPNLLARTGNSTNRLSITAMACIQEIAVLKDVRVLQFIPLELVKPFKSNFPIRLAQSRAEMLESLLEELGTENSGFTLENVMMFCTAALEHGASAVREVALRIIMSMYKQHSSAVLSYLPTRNASRYNFLYKTLFDGFSKVDGQMVATQGGDPRDGQEEKEEGIHSVQKQLAAMKELTERDSKSIKGQMAKKEVPKVGRVSQKAGKQILKLPPNKTTRTVEVHQSVTYLDNLCIFCGKTDDSFTDDGLDLHYWKHCPMLRRCDECRQVVEIAGFTEHLLNECESRAKFSQCQRCSEAVATEELTRHVQGTTCKPPISGKHSSHCPLCHTNFLPGEEAWKAHLTGREGCKQNSRRTAVSQRTQPAQGTSVASAKVTHTWSAGTRGRAKPLGRGSHIPPLAPLARGHTPGKR
ncbi:centrosomal protein of 104 kDa isoform X1 [Phyllopteryx taeniolatus]|uniref:centrosomal protein of 104 kDa isoform X1 n=1 Tax=Phyllopteryx taeniolatus TaxID=161469 RepID=UPI002AD41E22|nr:centrosomal protein of 104 kDa isoform X1 [Phyllopteryx taeniolatus]